MEDQKPSDQLVVSVLNAIQADIREVNAELRQLSKQGAVHNELLRTHEARSLALQESQRSQDSRLKPVEDHVRTLNSIAKWVLGLVLAGVGTVVTILITRWMSS